MREGPHEVTPRPCRPRTVRKFDLIGQKVDDVALICLAALLHAAHRRCRWRGAALCAAICSAALWPNSLFGAAFSFISHRTCYCVRAFEVLRPVASDIARARHDRAAHAFKK